MTKMNLRFKNYDWPSENCYSEESLRDCKASSVKVLNSVSNSKLSVSKLAFCKVFIRLSVLCSFYCYELFCRITSLGYLTRHLSLTLKQSKLCITRVEKLQEPRDMQ